MNTNECVSKREKVRKMDKKMRKKDIQPGQVWVRVEQWGNNTNVACFIVIGTEGNTVEYMRSNCEQGFIYKETKTQWLRFHQYQQKVSEALAKVFKNKLG